MDEAFFGPGGPAGHDHTNRAPETFRAKLVFPDPADARFGRPQWVDVHLSVGVPPWILRIPRTHDGHVDVFEREELPTASVDVEVDVEYVHIGITPPT